MQLSTYVTEIGDLRMFLIFVYENYILYFYSDYSILRNSHSARSQKRTRDVRDANITTAFMFRDSERFKNEYLWAFSLMDGKPSFQVYIISEIVSWLKRVDLDCITNAGDRVDTDLKSINFISAQNSFIIRAYQKNKIGQRKDTFYYYRIVNGTEIELFDTYRTESSSFPISKIIAVNNDLYYLIHESCPEIDIYTINKEYKTHYVEYTLRLKNNTQYISGNSCGKYLVMETKIGEFHVYDIDDILSRFRG